MSILTIETNDIKNEIDSIDERMTTLQKRRDELDSTYSYLVDRVKSDKSSKKLPSLEEVLRTIFMNEPTTQMQISYILRKVKEIRPNTSYGTTWGTLKLMFKNGEIVKPEKGVYAYKIRE